jgi:hypothetical protein
MPYIAPNANQLGGTPKVGTGDCVALAQFYAGVPNHRLWRPGEQVLDNRNIRMGTAIATFIKGRSPENDTGQHTALFLRHGAPGTGFWVMDQYKDKPGEKVRPVQARFVRTQPYVQNSDGTWWNASNNARAFSTIELR